jgi:hypothetical protein
LNVSLAKWRFLWVNLVYLVFVVGCTSNSAGTPNVTAPPADEEGAVRKKFAELQSAIAGHDAATLWTLLDAKSQADAERAAKEIQAAYAKAGADEKVKQAETLGLSGPDMAELTGPGILKTKRFKKRYSELPESKIEKVVIQGENAVVHYVESDGDQEKLILLRSGAQWKVWLAIPKLPQS